MATAPASKNDTVSNQNAPKPQPRELPPPGDDDDDDGGGGIGGGGIPIGYLDSTNSDGSIIGWTLDPDYPSTETTVQFYANGPVGSSNCVYCGETTANVPRPDVNSVTGYPGNHGFNWVLPPHFMTPCPPAIYAYGLNLSGSQSTLLTSSSGSHPDHLPMPYLVKTIFGGTNSQPLSVGFASEYSTAILSIHWNGLEFVNNADHGRLVQSDVVLADGFGSDYIFGSTTHPGECYNPTEAGSYGDDHSPYNYGIGCTSSEILSMSITASNQLTSECNMAFWCPPGGSTGSSISGNCGPGDDQNTTIASNTNLQKTVTVGLPSSYSSIANYQNIIQIDVTYQIWSGETHTGCGGFEPLACYCEYTNGLTVMGSYDPSTNSYANLTLPPSSDTYLEWLPLIISSSDGNYAIGIYSPYVTQDTYNLKTCNYAFSHQSSDSIKIGFYRRTGSLTSYTNPSSPFCFPNFSFTTYLAIGTLSQVCDSIGGLYSSFPPAPIG